MQLYPQLFLFSQRLEGISPGLSNNGWKTQYPPHRKYIPTELPLSYLQTNKTEKVPETKIPFSAHRCLFTDFNWISYLGLFYVVLNKISLQEIAKTIYRVYNLHLLSLKTCLSVSMKTSQVLASNYYSQFLTKSHKEFEFAISVFLPF